MVLDRVLGGPHPKSTPVYGSGSQPVVKGPPVVLDRVPGGPQLNDGDLGSLVGVPGWGAQVGGPVGGLGGSRGGPWGGPPSHALLCLGDPSRGPPPARPAPGTQRTPRNSLSAGGPPLADPRGSPGLTMPCSPLGTPLADPRRPQGPPGPSPSARGTPMDPPLHWRRLVDTPWELQLHSHLLIRKLVSRALHSDTSSAAGDPLADPRRPGGPPLVDPRGSPGLTMPCSPLGTPLTDPRRPPVDPRCTGAA